MNDEHDGPLPSDMSASVADQVHAAAGTPPQPAVPAPGRDAGLPSADAQLAAAADAQNMEPDPTVALVAAGTEAIQAGNWAEAKELFRQAVALEPNQDRLWLQLGIAERALRHFDEAQRAYEQVLQLNPRSAEAHNNLGNVLQDQGRFEAAVEAYDRALQIQPDYIRALLNLAELVQRLGQLNDAAALYRRVLMFNADEVTAHRQLAGLALGAGDLDEAEARCRRAMELDPSSADVHNNLGTVLVMRGQAVEAVDHLRRAVELNPMQPNLRSNLALALQVANQADEAIAQLQTGLAQAPDELPLLLMLGQLYRQVGRLDEAVQCLRHATEKHPGDAPAWNDLGVALVNLGRYDEAAAAFSQAIQLDPQAASLRVNRADAELQAGRLPSAEQEFRAAIGLAPQLADAHQGLGASLHLQGRKAEAIDSYQEALRLDAKRDAAWTMLGVARFQANEYAEARLCFEQAISLNPRDPSPQFHLARLLLLDGDYANGWTLLGQRHRLDPALALPKPFWAGEALDGRTLLLHTEQGPENLLQFARFLPQIQQRGARIIVACHSTLARLAAKLPGVAQVVSEGQLPEFDVHATWDMLPAIFQVTEETVPADGAYLAMDDAELAPWDQVFDTDELHIGLFWHVPIDIAIGSSRSIPLAEFAPLMAIPNVKFYSLQVGLGREQLTTFEYRDSVVDLGDQLHDFNDLAAAISCLDLLICCDGPLAHLAGALDVPTCVVLAEQPDWRWMLEREDSPWYPSLRLFRQAQSGHWDEVFGRLADGLRGTVEAALSGQ